MTAPSTIVATLARMLEVLHTDSSDRDLLKSAFRDLYAAVEPSGAAISIAMVPFLLAAIGVSFYGLQRRAWQQGGSDS